MSGSSIKIPTPEELKTQHDEKLTKFISEKLNNAYIYEGRLGFQHTKEEMHNFYKAKYGHDLPKVWEKRCKVICEAFGWSFIHSGTLITVREKE